MERKLRVAAYCRVSTDQADQANSFETQQRYFREQIEKNPEWILQDIYADEGLSGTSTKKRKRFNDMIAAAKAGEIDLILTKEVSRFARNTVDTLAYTRALRALGVGVLFLIDGIHTLDADGELRLTIMASLAQEESRRTSHRVKWGQTQRMRSGVVFGGSLLGYRVEKGKITVESEGAEIVRSIFHQYLNERKGAAAIARELRERGVLSSRGLCKWSASTVLKILKNEKYCGDLVQKKTYTPNYLSHAKKYNTGQEDLIALRDHHESIIDRDTWNAVQQELQRRRHTAGANSGHGSYYPLSGKIRCAACGSSFLRRTRSTKAGESYHVWRCGKASREGKRRSDEQGNTLGCDVGRQLREDVAMDLLRRTVQAVAFDGDAVVRSLCGLIEEVRKERAHAEEGELHRLERKRKSEEERKVRIWEAYFDQTITKEDCQLLIARCDEKIAHIASRRSAMEKQHGQAVQKEETDAILAKAIRGILRGEWEAEAVYSRLLHHMTVDACGRVEVVLEELPARWCYKLVSSCNRMLFGI